MGFVSTLDSYFLNCQAKMASLGAATNVIINGQSVPQPFAGIVHASDWPQTPYVEGSLYLLLLEAKPIGGTDSQTLYEFICQWSWILIGSDIGKGQVGQNRSDRYRTNA